MNAHFLQCHASVRVLKTAIYNVNFTVLLRIEQNFTKLVPTASGVLLLVSRIIYLNKCNLSDIITFRLYIML